MVAIGFHASHEQHSPRELLAAVRLAEAVGFDEAMCSDHLAPWTRAQGHSGHAWSWLGAALASTTMPFGLVTAPGQRYHPVIAAQAIGTLAQMFPDRFWAALGSGEALNEHVTGDGWPDKPRRQRRLRESADAIRGLLAGERVDVSGEIVVHDARVWSRPEAPVPLVGAAVSAETAAWVADWADGLITVGADPEGTAEVLARYRDAGGRGPARLQVHVSLGRTDDEALAVARDQWAHCGVPAELMWELENPEDYERLAEVTDEALHQDVVISASASAMADRIAALAEGFDHVYIHHVGKDQATFLRRCENELLPALRRAL
ncbi:TIGR03885 family FMN-dependent LLM class oxidoreductase [Microbacterium sp. 179-I 3D4 NHS]|uniref:TIGR03885 family FMN-dependent LLM class oxidoreductase n=1 Tax=Microbacterium sp. 179-I 3D4 NHS TaxID=3142381 RepID=UPI0039A02D3A